MSTGNTEQIETAAPTRSVECSDGLVRMWSLIEELRCDEGESVTLVADNADYGGPNNIIFVQGSWTDWIQERYAGESLLDCLEQAVADKRAALLRSEK